MIQKLAASCPKASLVPTLRLEVITACKIIITGSSHSYQVHKYYANIVLDEARGII